MLSFNTIMQGHVWPIQGIYQLPPLSTTGELLKQQQKMEFLLRSSCWVPWRLEFSKVGFLDREKNARSPGFNDGRHYKRYFIF